MAITFAPAPQPGSHELPLFLTVGDGKRIQLLLRGRTTPPTAQVPLLLPSDVDFQMQVCGGRQGRGRGSAEREGVHGTWATRGAGAGEVAL